MTEKPCAKCGRLSRVAARPVQLYLVLLQQDANEPHRKGQYWCAECTADDGFKTVAQTWAY